MPDSLPVHVNRTGIHSLEVPHEFDATGSFDVDIVNHGESLHVHLHLDDALSSVASIDAANHHIEADSERRIRVTVHDDGPVRGKLKIVTAYGAETRYVDIVVPEGGPENEPVIVDEDLAKPQPKTETESEPLLEVLSTETLFAAGGGIVALVVGLLTLALTSNLLLTLGALVAVAGVLGALYLAVVQ
ncbi:DUF7524 family protein [Haloarcula salina]|uniref:DUF7524 family protein n=1 Tax=Haloarcula salina TaxID=1429914 RepID=UPI003C6F897E